MSACVQVELPPQLRELSAAQAGVEGVSRGTLKVKGKDRMVLLPCLLVFSLKVQLSSLSS